MGEKGAKVLLRTKVRYLFGGLMVVGLLWGGLSVMAEGDVLQDVRGLDTYNTPCVDTDIHTDVRVNPWDSYCDLEIVHTDGGITQCHGISDTLNPPEPGSGDPVIRVVVDDDPAQRGDYTRMGCEIWIHPDRIHRRINDGAVGVRVDWPTNRSLAFVITDKIDGVDPQPVDDPNTEEVEVDTPMYIGPQPTNDTHKHVDSAGKTVIPGEVCESWMSPGSGWTYYAFYVPIMEVSGTAPNNWAPNEDGDWVQVTIPYTIYTCSF